MSATRRSVVLGQAERLLPPLWAGALLCIVLLAAPAPFAVLQPADAGRVVARIFAQEGWVSLFFAGMLLWAARRGAGARRRDSALLWASVACTLAGTFAVAALLPAARAGQGLFSFGQLHVFSMLAFSLKTTLVLWLAWRAVAAPP
jgi:hypothetical protein